MPFQATKTGLLIRVRLTPSGGADRIDGLGEDAAGSRHLKVRVRAAPEDGKANAALEALLAKTLRVPRSSVAVAKGATARVKTVAVEGLSRADAARLLIPDQESP